MRCASATICCSASVERRGRQSAGRGATTLRLLYFCGAMQGLALVTFPAASAIFTSPTGFHLSSAQYGAMFVPQVALAIFASAFGPGLARRLGMRGLLLLGLGADLLAMSLLAASALLIGAPAAFALLCCATGALGFGFGATVTTLNTLVERLCRGTARRRGADAQRFARRRHGAGAGAGRRCSPRWECGGRCRC